jgi:lactaldehyde dehydrogenase
MRMLINGNLIDKDKKINVINPANNSIIDTVPFGKREDAKKAIHAANNAKKAMKDISSRRISRILYDIHHDLSKSLDEFATIITKETGKPIRDSKFEMERSLDTLLFAAEESKRIYGETIPLDAGIGGSKILGFTIKIPVGVLSAITPFNYPVNLAMHKIAPAIVAKNTVVTKPSHKAPLAALKLVKLMAPYLPDGALNALTGIGMVIGDEMVTNNLVNKISFTGSVTTGKSIAQKAGVKKLTLELGGNDPLVILDDANIDNAVTAAVRGSYVFAGQVCIAVKRIIIQTGVFDEFTDKLVSETKKLKVGDPLNSKTDVGPLIDEEAALKVENRVNNALDDGAELLCGGKRNGAFYEPTVLDRVFPNMELVCKETFGPIAPIIRVDDVDEAFKMANHTPYGLQASVFTESIEKAKRAVKSIDAGTVLINKESTFRTDNMPFGGFKMSGIGKEGVKYAVEDMTCSKLVIIG